MTGTMTDDCLHRFLFDDLDIRGALVRLGPAWRAMIENRPTLHRLPSCWVK
jgi:redox-regulated HSP33 family molecular chaperone